MDFFKKHSQLSIFLLAFVLFVPFLGAVHLFDWDEINFAECAREMLVTKNYLNLQMNYLPFWEKPPLFIWLSAFSMKIFGINEFAARLPNAICGMLTLVLIFNIGKKIVDEKLGLLWVLCYAGSTLPHFYFKTGIIDPWFNLLIFCSVYYFALYTYQGNTFANKKWQHVSYAAILLGLAVLTKGPAAAIILGICFILYMQVRLFKIQLKIVHLLVFLAVTAIVGGLWFVLLYVNGQGDIIKHFISYQVHLFNTQDSGHGGPFYYHFVVLLLGCFPASVFALFAFKNTESEPLRRHFKLWMILLFWVVLLLFSIVATKIIHYSSLCYFPLTFFAAQYLHQLWLGDKKWTKWQSVLVLLIGGLFALLLTVLALAGPLKEKIMASKLINDDFALANLQANVSWTGLEVLIGIGLFMAIVFSVVKAAKGQSKTATLVLFIGNMLVVELTALVMAPKIEQYTQGAAIEFFEAAQHKNAYCLSLNYHSYAQYFYSKKMPPAIPESLVTDWLLRGPNDKEVLVISKNTSKSGILQAYPDLQLSGEKNGFVFYRRPITAKTK